MLQDRNQKRKDKLDIFRILMMNRGMGWTNETVKALNIIDIVFSDDDMVRKQWKEYYNKLGIESPDEMQRKQVQEAHDKLLEVMAHSLGYKNQISWETIQKPYIHPDGNDDCNAATAEYSKRTGKTCRSSRCYNHKSFISDK